MKSAYAISCVISKACISDYHIFRWEGGVIKKCSHFYSKLKLTDNPPPPPKGNICLLFGRGRNNDQKITISLFDNFLAIHFPTWYFFWDPLRSC